MLKCILSIFMSKKQCAKMQIAFSDNSHSPKIFLICLVILVRSTSNKRAISFCVSHTVSSSGLTFTSKLNSPSSNFIKSYFFLHYSHYFPAFLPCNSISLVMFSIFIITNFFLPILLNELSNTYTYLSSMNMYLP